MERQRGEERMKNHRTYHLRADPRMRRSDVVSDLANAVWRSLIVMREFKGLDPGRWPGVYLVFRDVFKRCVSWQEDRYILEAGRDMAGFSWLLAGLARRRLRDAVAFPAEARRLVADVLVRTMAGHCGPDEDRRSNPFFRKKGSPRPFGPRDDDR
jgi:hypothetical protein